MPEYPFAPVVQVYCHDMSRYAPACGMVIRLVVGFDANKVLDMTCETLKLTNEALVTVPAIESHFAVPAEASTPESRSLRLSTFPTSEFHWEDCSWLPETFPRSAA